MNLAREGQEVTRWNMLTQKQEQKSAYIGQIITKDKAGPAIAATDYVKNILRSSSCFIDTDYRCIRY